ncbi:MULTISPECIES: Gfo/Idh/MocA family oxidoreductase [unclassified Pseudonocardia]|uniref:Gfo/Idh/MocA family protein n=1 Tax=unclassified Pseudonocardia TaxID=2619320 RepID=UPI000963E236|nr:MULTISPECIES: Gfo/Idh/MocA family oxidoreductase [unclassified Pseudonocardia]MBN9098783.1 Gfo/Idh/MocA family oxidoreductase [Pseudonocardia sp.]OJY40983.1 MAG: oxidoreductase [Pseudonocardia sp. 73-21]
MRVGLVGGGPWARGVHGPAIVAHPATTLTGVWTRRPEQATELAASLGSTAYADLDALIADVDVVALAVPPLVQGALVVRAAAAGRHLICEKPLAETLDGAREVVEAVTRAGVHSSIVLTLRHAPDVQSWLAGIPSTPGVDTTGSARWLSGALLGGPFAASPWRAEQGALLDVGPHLVDLLVAALGPVTGVDWAHRTDPDLWRFGLTHAGGATSTVITSLALPVDPTESEFTVFGGAGVHRLPGRVWDAASSYAHLLDELVAAVRGTGPAPALDAAHGLRLQEILDEVRAVVG